MIKLINLNKTYKTKNGNVLALKNVSLNIERGEIFGVIGYSGAGKSTLIRCINLLEVPDSGNVVIKDKDLTKLSTKELRHSRTKIGMIFQHFNLMRSRTVFENIAYPLKGSKLSKSDISTKVTGLLELVGLKDKSNAYPSELSGGQKQRVAIARALANDPEVLLCDEATSALDPKTTKSILELLKKINSLLNITIVLITHEMQVVKEICDKVAVMDSGEIAEKGSLIDIFTNPKAKITKDFIATITNKEAEIQAAKEAPDSEVFKLTFLGEKSREAVISKISRDFNIDVNILHGNIEKIQGVSFGSLIIALYGDGENIIHAINYLKNQGIRIEVLKNDRNFEELSA